MKRSLLCTMFILWLAFTKSSGHTDVAEPTSETAETDNNHVIYTSAADDSMTNLRSTPPPVSNCRLVEVNGYLHEECKTNWGWNFKCPWSDEIYYVFPISPGLEAGSCYFVSVTSRCQDDPSWRQGRLRPLGGRAGRPRRSVGCDSPRAEPLVARVAEERP